MFNDIQALFHSMRPFAVACLVTALGRRTAGADLQPALSCVHGMGVYLAEDVHIILAVTFTLALRCTWAVWPQGGDSFAAPERASCISLDSLTVNQGIAVVECVKSIYTMSC